MLGGGGAIEARALMNALLRPEVPGARKADHHTEAEDAITGPTAADKKEPRQTICRG
jgi:hypothetical protein